MDDRVRACAMVGLPDDRLGQKVAVSVQPADSGDSDELITVLQNLAWPYSPPSPAPSKVRVERFVGDQDAVQQARIVSSVAIWWRHKMTARFLLFPRRDCSLIYLGKMERAKGF